MQRLYDIIIVGGGMAGTALACALGESGFRIALLESGDYDVRRPPEVEGVSGYDTRVSALGQGSTALLQRLGAWPRMRAARACPYTHMHVWDAQGTGAVDFDAAEVRQRRLGHIVENRVTVWALRQCLMEHLNVDVRGSSKVVQLVPIEGADPERAQPAYSLLLSDGTSVEASLVVAADGAQSMLRKLAGFSTREWDYGQVATVAAVRVEQSHRDTAWQRFLPTGPLAFLPLSSSPESGHFCSIVWSAQSELAGDLSQLDDAAFRRVLGESFEHRLGSVLQVGARVAYPLRQRHAVSYYKPGLVLVGDAAHSLHPLAGQGINLGFKDVAALAEELIRARNLELAPGAVSVLARYQRRRIADNLGMMAIMEGFKRLFGESHLGIRWLRNEGMNRFNRAPWLKQQLIRRAMDL